jgi:hypothetical protein
MGYERMGPAMTATEIVDEILSKHGVTRDEVRGPSRAAKLVHARREIVLALHTRVRIQGRPPSLSWIGQWIGRHYTSVLWYLQNPEPSRYVR